jgi:hypothetical protein
VGQCGCCIGPFSSPNTKMCSSYACSIKNVVNKHLDIPFIQKKFLNILGWTHTHSLFQCIYSGIHCKNMNITECVMNDTFYWNEGYILLYWNFNYYIIILY